MKKYNFMSSIFTRAIIVFLLIVAPVYVLGITIFNISREMLINQYNDGIHKQICIYFENLESDFYSIRQMQENLLLDEDLNKLKYIPMEELDYDVVTSINRVMKQLNNINLSSENVHTVDASITKLGRRLCDSSSFSTYQNITSDQLDEELNSLIGEFDIKYRDGEYYIITTPTYWNRKIEDLTFVVRTQLSKKQIINTINRYNVVEGSISSIYFNEFQSTLSMDNESDTAKFVMQLDSSNQEIKQMKSMKIADTDYLVARYYSDYLNAWYTQLIPEKTALASINNLKIWYGIFTVLVAITSIAYTIFTYIMIKKPMDILVNSFKEVENENFDVNIRQMPNDEFAIVYESFNGMVAKIKRLINEVYLEKILNQKSELRQLQAQINPHFLYNSFFILKNRIAKKQYEGAVQFCDMLGLYFNYITKNYKDYSTLEDELNHARIYADIQAIRFAGRIEVKFDEMPPQYKNIIVPKLILQPLVENAFKYGLEKMEFDGILKVSFESQDNELNIIVEDNGQIVAKDQEALDILQQFFNDEDMIKEPTGLLNIHRRIRLFSSRECGISFCKSELGGLKVIIKIIIDDKIKDRNYDNNISS